MTRSPTVTWVISGCNLFSEDGRRKRDHQVDTGKDQERKNSVFESAGIAGFLWYHRFYAGRQVSHLSVRFESRLFNLLKRRLQQHVPGCQIRLRPLYAHALLCERGFSLCFLGHARVQVCLLGVQPGNVGWCPIRRRVVGAGIVQKRRELQLFLNDLQLD